MVMTRIIEFSGVSALTLFASDLGVVSRPNFSMTGARTTGMLASRPNDDTAFCTNVDPWTSSPAEPPSLTDTKTVALELYVGVMLRAYSKPSRPHTTASAAMTNHRLRSARRYSSSSMTRVTSLLLTQRPCCGCSSDVLTGP